MPLYSWVLLLSLRLASLLHEPPVPVVAVVDTIPLHLKIAISYVGTTELTGHNDGPKIEYIIRHGGGAPHASYCAYFVSFCLDSAHVKTPTVRSGLARSFKLKNSIKANDVLIGKVKILPGTILVWQKGETINGHTGFTRYWFTKSGGTTEANTSPGTTGSQANGGGIYDRTRSIEPANFFRITAFTPVTYK